MSISQNFPATWPSLSLDFANSKTLDPRVTFTRASTATYVGADGLVKTAVADQARFDHDPVTGESLGLLIEESRSNVWLSSELPNNWAQLSTTVTNNYTTSPSGTQTAGRIGFNGTTSNWDIVYQGSYTGTYVWSAWLKTEDGSSKTVYVTWGSPDNAKRVALNINGTWRRYSAVVTPSSENVHLGNHHNLTPAGWSSFAIHIWGAQLESGSYPTSYIPTSGSTVTRAVDTTEITGTNFSNWYNQTEGSFFTETEYRGSASVVFELTPSSPRTVLGSIGTNVAYINKAGGVVYTSNSPISPGVFNKITVTDKSADGNLFVNGTLIGNSNGTGSTTYTGIIFGNSAFSERMTGHIKRVMYYPERLTNSQLQVLTK